MEGNVLTGINKASFIKKFDGVENGIISSIYDKIIIFERTGKNIFCDYFFTPNIWKRILELKGFIGCNMVLNGGFDDAERKMICFSQKSSVKFPLKIMIIKNDSKFSHLEHRDFLGSLMSLGVKREKFGDLICSGENCYVSVCEDISEYIITNFKSAGRCPCSIKTVESDNLILPSTFFQNKVIICASMRLDSVVSSLCNVSRGNASSYIENGNVLVDYVEARSRDKLITEGSIITVKGFGKFIIKEETGFTGSGKVKVTCKVYK